MSCAEIWRLVVEICQLVADIATVVTVLIMFVELKKNADQYQKDKQHDRKKNTLDAYNLLQKEVFDFLYTEYSKVRIKEIAEHPRKAENNGDYHRLGTYTARIEHFCVGVNQEIYDWETVYELAHGFFDGTMREWIEPLMERKQSYTSFDPYKNTKKVLLKLDREAEKRGEVLRGAKQS